MSSDERLRVLHVRTVSGTGGGPDKTILKSCRYLAERGHTAEAFYVMDRRSDTTTLPAVAEGLGVKIHLALEEGAISFGTVRKLKRTLRQGRFQILETHDYKSNFLARLLRFGNDYRIVATTHGYNRTTRREAAYYALEKMLLPWADAVIAPTLGMYHLARSIGVPPERLNLIHNGIEISRRPSPVRFGGNGRAHVLYLGRLSPEKDPANLIEAAAILAERGRRFSLTLAGDGPERPRLEALIQERGLTGQVELLGFVREIIPLLQTSDILVSPSRTECMPNAILEAMWAGVPVVATRVGGVSEVIRNGQDGLLCPPRSPEALASAIERLMEDRELAQALAESAYRRVTTEFSFERRMYRMIQVYREVLSGRIGSS